MVDGFEGGGIYFYELFHVELEDFYRGIVCRCSFSTLKLKGRKQYLAAILRFVFTVKNKTLHRKIRMQCPEE